MLSKEFWLVVLIIVNTAAIIVYTTLKLFFDYKWKLRIEALESQLLGAILISKAHAQITEGQQKDTAKVVEIAKEKTQELTGVAEVIKEAATVITKQQSSKIEFKKPDASSGGSGASGF